MLWHFVAKVLLRQHSDTLYIIKEHLHSQAVSPAGRASRADSAGYREAAVRQEREDQTELLRFVGRTGYGAARMSGALRKLAPSRHTQIAEVYI